MSFSIKDEMPQLAQQYAMYLRNVRGLSPKTVDEYCLDLRTIFRFLKSTGAWWMPACPRRDHRPRPGPGVPARRVLLRDLRVYELHRGRAQQHQLHPPAEATSLKSFSTTSPPTKNCWTRTPRKPDPAQKSQGPSPFPVPRTKYRTLKRREGPDAQRDRCILTLFLNCGMLLSELVGIDLNDVIRNNNTLRILGKGNKERIVYLNQACLDSIAAYLAVRPKDGVIDRNAPVPQQPRQTHQPQDRPAPGQKIPGENRPQRPGYSVHKLRHTAATLMYRYGNVDIRVLQDILGHANLGTTEIYTHTSSTQMESAINANPLSQVAPKQERKSRTPPARTKIHDKTKEPWRFARALCGGDTRI